MAKKVATALFLFLISHQILLAQAPKKPDVGTLFHQIQKLNFLGSVLYIAAHPDDENTRLISYLSNEKKARTGYLSLTRGDGGQNLIGPELREILGVIRTQELLEARKIDGGEQFFSRANDFGYSKNPDETLSIWDKQQVLSDVVWAIRKFQPDVIINRFDHRSPGTTHGHHTSSALLSVESFDLANNPKSFESQLKQVSVWQPKRLFFNTSWWFYGSKEKFDAADKSNLSPLQIGTYYPLFGKSNQEIAALSRSRHQSQGFGSTGSRGEELEYLEFLKGDSLQDKSNIFEGIDTSWNRISGGKPIGELVNAVEKEFDFKNPSASIPKLVRAYELIQQLDENHWKPIKTEELKKIILACGGIYLEAIAENQNATKGSNLKVRLEAINRSTQNINLKSVQGSEEPIVLNENLANNKNFNTTITYSVLEQFEFTAPCWLKEKGTEGMYRVDNQENIGIPDIIRQAKITFTIEINDVTIPFDTPIVYKYNDNVKGEVYNPFDVVPDVSVAILDKVTLFNPRKKHSIGIKIKAGKSNVAGELTLELPQDWKVNPQNIPINLAKIGEEQTVYFEVTAPKNETEITAKCVALIDGKRFDQEQLITSYDHISKQQILKTAEAKFLNTNLKIGKEKIAYIMGAGDEVPKSLIQMGYSVSIIKPESITKVLLTPFDVVITGIRAYNTIKTLAFKQDLLFDFVKEGKTMIVQYNTTDELVTKNIAPYSLKISKDRVTEENAEVRFLAPENTVLNYPNKITSKDFDGWKQEQGLYYPNEWDTAFTPILSANDKNESPKNGALLVAKYGKGHYIYSGLSFFRELPEGVLGAYRLMANLISIQ